MGSTLDEVIGGTDAFAHLEAAHDAAWTVTDPALLAMCRDRIIEHLGGDPADPAPSTAGVDPDVEPARCDAVLTFVEQYLVDVASVTDDQVAPLREALGDQGLVDFLHALLVIEQRIRLELIWRSVL